MKRYAYIGTGNFNENTALIYSDFGLFTSHDEITEDVLNVFLFLSNNHKQFTFKHLMVSPYYMRMQFVDMIDREISHAKKGKKLIYTPNAIRLPMWESSKNCTRPAVPGSR